MDGELPSEKIYEDKDVLVFIDINPVNEGHVLVIPKQHYESILETPDELLKKMVVIEKKTSIAVKKALNCGLHIAKNIGSEADQKVFHTHTHIIPRFSDDGLHHWPQKSYSGTGAKDMADKIKLEMTRNV